MADDPARAPTPAMAPGAQSGRSSVAGSLRQALLAAGMDDEPAAAPAAPGAGAAAPAPRPAAPSAAEAAREARGDRHVEPGAPTTRVVRAPARGPAPGIGGRTQLIRGKVAVRRTDFYQDPVVGWLVVVGGPGLGAFRPVFEGNNTVGRSGAQRVPLDFGDDTISAEEQAYIRYDSAERKFLLVPNLAKTNIVSVNDRKPTGAVELQAMDLITMGRTQLVFVPFCSPEFDWSELGELKG